MKAHPTTHRASHRTTHPTAARLTRLRSAVLLAAVLATSCAGPAAAAQGPVGRQVATIREGTVRLSFRARAGVCGNGNSNSMSWNGGGSRSKGRNEWENECEPGPVRVAIDVENGAPVNIRFYVGGRWRAEGSATDLGTVGAADAGNYFMWLAERSNEQAAKDAIPVAVIADSATVWPALLRIARNEERPRDIRKNSVFWLGQAASDAIPALDGLANADSEDIEIRKAAVFALSQRPKKEGVPALLKIVRGKGDARVRKQAIFWLGQSGDPRAVAYFEEVLTRKQ